MGLTKRTDGRWCKTKTINGERIFFYSTEPTERKAIKDIENQMLEYSGKIQRGKTFKEVADEWERIKREELEPTTWKKCYRGAYSHVTDYFDEYVITEITPQEISRYFLNLKNSKYSQKSVLTRKSVLNMIFELAFVSGYIDNNFIPSVPLPTGLTKNPRKAPTDSDINIATQNYDGDDFLLYFLAYTGLRISEACAITDKDIDLKHNFIVVNKKVVWDNNNKPIVKHTTKTEAGTRNVPLVGCLKAKLPKFKGYLFSRTDGETPLTGKQLRILIENYKKRHSTDFTPHQLRHAFASLGVDAELSVKELQYVMGHSDIHTTMDIYAEIRQKQQKKITDKMNSANY